MTNTYYHNPRCTKSRKGLELLNSSEVNFEVKEYLKEPLSEKELLNIFKKLTDDSCSVIRKKEDLYKELGLDKKDLSKTELAQVIINNPKLLERPIFLTDKEAIIGRPTEILISFLEKTFKSKF